MPKKVLVTAGNTLVKIDQVRGLTNVFKGRTGAAIAEYFANQGCFVTLLTSHPELVTQQLNLTIVPFRTYSGLFRLMEGWITSQSFDVVIHSAAISDYFIDSVCEQVGDVREVDGRFFVELKALDSSGKIGSNHQTMWMRTAPTTKIVDQIRKPFNFKGTLVKFKLQVNMPDEELIKVATQSMKHSEADFIVANTLETMRNRAFIISADGRNPILVKRKDLPAKLYEELAL